MEMGIFLLFLCSTALAIPPATCPATEKMRPDETVLKGDFDGSGKDDRIVSFVAEIEGDHHTRRALFLNPARATPPPDDKNWLEPCTLNGEPTDATSRLFEKRSVPGRDLILAVQEIGEFAEYELLDYQGTEKRSHLKYSNAHYDGQYSDSNKKKALEVQITGEGDLTLEGQKVDLVAADIKLKCRQKGLMLKLNLAWNPKTQKLEEKSRDCVIGQAID
ncbi:MAG: hypothetical protein AB7F86_12375 [Bdellovibrionales bacterium]